MPIGRLSFILFLWTALGFLGCLLTGNFNFFGQGSSAVDTMQSMSNPNITSSVSPISQFMAFADGGLEVLKALWASLTFPITFLASPNNDFFSKAVFIIIFLPTVGGTSIALIMSMVRGTSSSN